MAADVTLSLEIQADSRDAVDELKKVGKAGEETAKSLQDLATGAGKAVDGIDATAKAQDASAKSSRAHIDRADAVLDRWRQTREESAALTERIDQQRDAHKRLAEEGLERARSAAERWAEEAEAAGRASMTMGTEAEEAARHAKDAAEEIDDLGEAIADTSEATEGWTGALGKLSPKMLAGGAAAAALVIGYSAIKGTTDALWESTERYFQSMDRDDLWASAERAARGYKGQLFELAIGTDDAEEAHRRLVDILEDGNIVLDGLSDLVQPLATGLRVTLSSALAFAAGQFEDTRDVMAQFRTETSGLITDMARYEEALAAAREETDPTTQAWDAYVANVRRAAEATVDMTENTILYRDGQRLTGRETREWLQANQDLAQNMRTILVPQIEDAIYAAEDLDSINVRLASSATAAGQRYEMVLPTITAGLRRTGDAFDGLVESSARFEAVREHTLNAEAAFRALEDAATSAGSVDTEGLSFNSLIGAAQPVLAAGLMIAEGLDEVTRAYADLQEQRKLDTAEKIDATELLRLQQREEDKAKVIDLFAERERRIRDEGERQKDEIDRREATRAANAQQRIAQSAGALSSAMANVIAGQASAEDAAKAFSGAVLNASAEAALAEAAMRFFQPGLGGVPAALGLIGAATAAKAVAAKLGASSTGSGAAPPSAPSINDSGAVYNNSLNIISNVQGLVDPATFQRQLADQVNEAYDRGLLRMTG